MGTYRVQFQYVTTGITFFRNVWAVNIEHLQDQFNTTYSPQLRVISVESPE